MKNVKQLNKRLKHHKVYAKKGDNIFEFGSVLEASQSTGVYKDKIYKCCNNKMSYTGGMEWSYTPFILNKEDNWKDCVGYEGLYQVNRQGEVRSSHKGGWKILVAGISNAGYRHFLFYKNGKRVNVRGNRLVAEAFIPNPDNSPFVNHKDENPSNDCVENLEWCTCEYNINYGTARERSSLNHRKNRPVCMFDVNGDFIREFYNINDAAKFVNGAHTCILRCCNNSVLCYKGYIWRYKEDIGSIGEAVTAYKNSKTTNRKIEVDIDGQKKVFNSMSEASRALGVSRDTIRKYNSKNNIKWELI